MKSVLLSLALAFCAGSVYAQYTVPQVIGSAGGHGRSAKVTLEWTVGETFIQTHRAPGLIVTQGFHQGDLRISKKASTRLPDESALAELNIRAFPNPTYDYVSLHLQVDELQDYSYVIYDMAGQELFRANIEQAAVSADFTALPKANYLLVVRQREVPVKVFQIIKQ